MYGWDEPICPCFHFSWQGNSIQQVQQNKDIFYLQEVTLTSSTKQRQNLYSGPFKHEIWNTTLIFFTFQMSKLLACVSETQYTVKKFTLPVIRIKLLPKQAITRSRERKSLVAPQAQTKNKDINCLAISCQKWNRLYTSRK